ncbi:MAG: metal-binding protein [Leptolyngbyaceae cyanobacterium CSU_1_3]|nr:metal-binding protein [Leptolyngbyaceae cyanobacterium CSU_1_3]
MKKPGGRLVLNHSTHIPGLIGLLEKLTSYPGIQTVTPGVIAPTRSHSPQFKLKISVPIRGGFKVIARHGKTAQEVFVVTTIAQEDLEAAIGQVMSS